MKGAWGLDQLVWGRRYPLISPRRHGYTSPVGLALLAEPLFLVLSLLADISRALGFILIKVPPAPSLQASSSHFLWEKEIQADLGNAFCRGGWHRVQVGKVIFNCLYLQSHSLVSTLAPPATPSPLSSLSCTIEPALPLLTLLQLCNCGLGHRLFFAWCQRLFSYQECVFKWPSPEQRL